MHFPSYETLKNFKSQLFQDPLQLSQIWQISKEIGMIITTVNPRNTEVVQEFTGIQKTCT